MKKRTKSRISKVFISIIIFVFIGTLTQINPPHTKADEYQKIIV